MTRNRAAAFGASVTCAVLAAAMSIDVHAANAAAPGYTTPGLSTAQLAQLPGVTYARPLMEQPPRNLIVIRLTFPPKRGTSSAPNPWFCHRPSGPVTIHVTKGAVRLGLNGGPAQILRAGASLYEPAQSLHSTAENASGAEPAEAFAVIAVPKDARVLITGSNCGANPSR